MAAVTVERITLQHEAAAEVEKHLKIPESVFMEVASTAYGAWQNATKLHPRNGARTFAYHDGVEALRRLALRHDYDVYTSSGVEGVISACGTKVIVYQNVDRACSAASAPKTPRRPDRGASLERVVKATGASKFLFPEDEAAYVSQLEALRKLKEGETNIEYWFLCVAIENEQGTVVVEVSKPKEIQNGQFGAMEHRIFLGTYNSHNDNPVSNVENSDIADEPINPEVTISRKT